MEFNENPKKGYWFAGAWVLFGVLAVAVLSSDGVASRVAVAIACPLGLIFWRIHRMRQGPVISLDGDAIFLNRVRYDRSAVRGVSTNYLGPNRDSSHNVVFVMDAGESIRVNVFFVDEDPREIVSQLRQALSASGASQVFDGAEAKGKE
jgi:hypothetical protein